MSDEKQAEQEQSAQEHPDLDVQDEDAEKVKGGGFRAPEQGVYHGGTPKSGFHGN